MLYDLSVIHDLLVHTYFLRVPSVYITGPQAVLQPLVNSTLYPIRFSVHPEKVNVVTCS